MSFKNRDKIYSIVPQALKSVHQVSFNAIMEYVSIPVQNVMVRMIVGMDLMK